MNVSRIKIRVVEDRGTFHTPPTVHAKNLMRNLLYYWVFVQRGVWFLAQGVESSTFFHVLGHGPSLLKSAKKTALLTLPWAGC